MRQYIWSTAALVCLFSICYVVESRHVVVKREESDSIDPNLQEVDAEDDTYRDKRKVDDDPKFGIKNAVLGFVFNPKHTQFAWETKPTTTTRRPTTTEDIVIFEKNKPVSLEIPDQLFGSSFTLITNLSNTVGDFMINSALRAQRLLESMRPFLQKIFGVKGIVIEAHTDKPIFSAPDS